MSDKILFDQECYSDFVVTDSPLKGNEVVPKYITSRLAAMNFVDGRIPRVYIGNDLSKLIVISCPDSFKRETDYGRDCVFYVYSPAEEYAVTDPDPNADYLAHELGLEWGVTRFQATLVGCIKVTAVKEIKSVLIKDHMIQYPILDYTWVPIPENKQ